VDPLASKRKRGEKHAKRVSSGEKKTRARGHFVDDEKSTHQRGKGEEDEAGRRLNARREKKDETSAFFCTRKKSARGGKENKEKPLSRRSLVGREKSKTSIPVCPTLKMRHWRARSYRREKKHADRLDRRSQRKAPEGKKGYSLRKEGAKHLTESNKKIFFFSPKNANTGNRGWKSQQRFSSILGGEKSPHPLLRSSLPKRNRSFCLDGTPMKRKRNVATTEKEKGEERSLSRLSMLKENNTAITPIKRKGSLQWKLGYREKKRGGSCAITTEKYFETTTHVQRGKKRGNRSAATCQGEKWER